MGGRRSRRPRRVRATGITSRGINSNASARARHANPTAAPSNSIVVCLGSSSALIDAQITSAIVSAPTDSAMSSPSLIHSPGYTAATTAAARPAVGPRGPATTARVANAIAATVNAPTSAIVSRCAVSRRWAFAASPSGPMIHEAGVRIMEVSGG